MLLFTVAVCPVYSATGAGYSNSLSHLSTDSVITGIFVAIIVLLVGVLLCFRRMNRELACKTRMQEESDRHFQLLGDHLPRQTMFQLVCTEEGRFVFRNLSKGIEQVLRINRDSLMKDARLVFDHIYEDDLPALRAAYRASVDTLAPCDLEIRMLDISGHLKWLQVAAVPHREGNRIAWVGFVQDITGRKAAEDELIDEKHNLQNLFETIDDLVFVCDMAGNLLQTNPAVQRRLDYTEKELKDTSLLELHPEQVREEIRQMIALLHSEQSISCELSFLTKSGDTVTVEASLFQGTWQNIPAIFGVARDTGARKKTETDLCESQNMLELIMDTIPMSIFWKDADSVYLGGNMAFIQECGLSSPKELAGKTPYDLFHKDTAEEMVRRDRQVIENNQLIRNALYEHALEDGSIRQRESSKVPLRDREGQIVGVLGVWRDVTEQNRSKERLKRTLEDMERFNQLMRGRERRTLELKTEVNSLLEELDRPPKYQTNTGSRS